MATVSPRSLRCVRSLVRVSNRRLYSVSIEDSIPAAKRRHVPTSGAYPQGFSVAGVNVGVKPSNTQFPDVALLESDRDCSAAAVFTKSHFAAAPVLVDKEVLTKSKGQGLRAIIINAGCANAVTGEGGMQDARKMVEDTDRGRKGQPFSSTATPQSLVMSTGVIGTRLPIDRILSGISKARSLLSPSHASWLSTARAICTTDTFPKLRSTTFKLPSSPSTTYSLAGIAKGAGMIHPDMAPHATLLSAFCTDVLIPASTLRPLLTYAADRSFHAISVDGDTSTNDTLAILANGAAGGSAVQSPDSEDGLAFRDVLTAFAQSMAHLVVRDGEGATKFVHIRVTQARSHEEARAIAQHIATSPLVKTALFAEDANWGRIFAKAGTTPGITAGAIVPERTGLSFVPADGSREMSLVEDGEPAKVDEERAKEVLGFEDLEIVLRLGTGEEEASYWTCDFSHECE